MIKIIGATITLGFLGIYFKYKEFVKMRPMLISKRDKRNYFLVSSFYLVGIILSVIILIDLESTIVNEINTSEEFSIGRVLITSNFTSEGGYSNIILYLKFISGLLSGFIVMLPLLYAGVESGNVIEYIFISPLILALSGVCGLLTFIVGPFPVALVLNSYVKGNIELKKF